MKLAVILLFSFFVINSYGQASNNQPKAFLSANISFSGDSIAYFQTIFTLLNDSNHIIYYPYSVWVDTNNFWFYTRYEDKIYLRNLEQFKFREVYLGEVTNTEIQSSSIKRISPNQGFNITREFKIDLKQFKRTCRFRVYELFIVEPDSIEGTIIEKFKLHPYFYSYAEISRNMNMITFDGVIDKKKKIIKISNYRVRPFKE